MKAFFKIDRNRILHDIVRLTITMFIVMVFSVPGVFADVTPSFDVEIVVNKDFSYDYTETITAYFDAPQHGIFRNIPMDNEYRIENISVEGHEYKVSKSDGFQVLRIGSASSYVEGEVVYPIHYTIRGIEDDDSEHDYMYMDVLPTGWDEDIASAHVVIHCPEDMPIERYNFFVGRYGDGTYAMENEYGKWTIDQEAHTITFDGKDLPRGMGATVDVELPDGYWVDPLSFNWMIRLFGYIGIAAAAVIALLRFTIGKNPMVVKPVEFYPPEDMTPLDIGYMIDGSVDPNDITSTFFYLADKGYINIEEDSKGVFKFERLAVPGDGVKTSIQRFYKGVFGTHWSDDIATTKERYNKVRSTAIGSRMSTAYEAIPDIVREEFSEAGVQLYTKSSKAAAIITKLVFVIAVMAGGIVNGIFSGVMEDEGFYVVVMSAIFAVLMLLQINALCRIYYNIQSRRRIYSVLMIVLRVSLYFILMMMYITIFSNFGGRKDSNFAYIAMLAMLVAAPLLIIGMRSRSRESADLYGRILGFKNFIRTAELPKLNELVEENPNYFYNILPYAYVFGLTNKWAKKFENIAMPEPTWYHSNVAVGNNYVYTTNNLTHAMNSVQNSITLQMAKSDRGTGRYYSSGSSSSGSSSSSSSWSSGGGGGGYSGGGFSGGGFGGGGGGKW